MNLKDANWHTFATKEEFYKHAKQARVPISNWVGAGKYAVMWYTQRCPRDCCDEYVCEAIPAATYAVRVREQIQELLSLLRQARS